MGLGKTIQTLAVLWTLLKQGTHGKGTTRHVIIVTPSSLVENWSKEIRKWLGPERLAPLVVQSSGGPEDVKASLQDFVHTLRSPVLILSYETLQRHVGKLTPLKGRVGLLVCDEGHRLKNAAGSKTLGALLALDAQRRILLTGTPIQNNLTEFFTLMNFVAPECLGSVPTIHVQCEVILSSD